MSDETEIKKKEDESELSEDQLDEAAGGVQLEEASANNTVILADYGTILSQFTMEPESKDWIERLKDQYDGSSAGQKPNGSD